MPANAHQAVFLSYAREDTESARRIADALRAFGIEVWFDQNELRGGDTWDQKIRQQIKDCALFVAIVSHNTQTRREGYFRREWNLAVERTLDMAQGTPFLVPVVVDDTRESAAIVPEQFMRVQWTRLAQGVPSPQFVEQVKRLLTPAANLEAGRPRFESPGSSAVPAAKSGAPAGFPRSMAIALGVVVVGLIAFIALRPTAKEAPAGPAKPPMAEAKPAAAPTPATSRASDKLAAADKSIAVLPFSNMSDEKDASAFFADGVHEDILTNLALVKDLKVISRTTAVQYRDSKKTIKQIGEELGVSYILEGSVRRAGNKVRVTGQLINARTDEHVWAKSYDRDITDVFAIQASLSQEIASALQAAITPQAQKFMERRPTENPAAYDSFLKGRSSRSNDRNNRAALKKQEAFFQDAVALDPKFAAAWGSLAEVHALNVFWEYDHTPARLAEADTAIAQAVRLAPDAPDVIRSLGTYAYYAYRDYNRAAEQYEKLARIQPNDPSVYSSLGLIQRRQGHWAESLENLRRALELEPANISYARNLATLLQIGRRWDEAIAVQRRVVAMTTGDTQNADRRDLFNLLRDANGSRQEREEWWTKLSPDQLGTPQLTNWRKFRAATLGDMAEFKRLDELHPYYDGDGTSHASQAFGVANTYLINGDAASARARLGNFPAEIRTQLQLEPANAGLWSLLAGMEAVLGQNEDAIAHARKAAELVPESRDAYDGPRYSARLAFTMVMTGDKDRAIAEFARLLRLPGDTVNVYRMKEDKFFAPLRGNPRFEVLLNDPKNNGALF